MKKENRRPPRFGEVYYMEFTGEGCEQRGWRPGMVYSNNIGNQYSPNIIALPFTTAMKKLGQPTHVVIPKEVFGMPRDSLVLCENPERMSKGRIGDFIGKVPESYLTDIIAAESIATGSIAYLDQEKLLAVWESAMRLSGGRKNERKVST